MSLGCETNITWQLSVCTDGTDTGSVTDTEDTPQRHLRPGK
jgi:hypothetical protein